MSTIARGYTFTNGITDQVTYTTLHALVDAATVTSIPLSEFASESHLIQVSASTPSSDQGDGSLWYDTALGIFRTKNGNARWDAPYVGPQMTNPAGTIPKGAWVVASGSATITMCPTGMLGEVLGVALNTLVSGASGIIATKGMFPVLAIGPCTIGDVLISAGATPFSFGAGYARTFHATGISSATLGVGIGQILGSLASGITGLATAMIWR